MSFTAWFYDDTSQRLEVAGKKLIVADGDSFAIGDRKLRLDGIDAPEYKQTCNSNGQLWDCGKASRTSLELMLRQPGLACTASASDKYARAIATCSNADVANIAAAQVQNGMALTNEFYGLRTYGDEEDDARNAKRGIWVGEFITPNQWRAANSR